MASCCRGIREKSAGWSRQRTSTRRRITPVLVQGASTRILSKDRSARPLALDGCLVRPIAKQNARVGYSQPNEIIAQSFQARLVVVDEDERPVVLHHLREIRSLAAGRSAGVEHVLARRRAARARRQSPCLDPAHSNRRCAGPRSDRADRQSWSFQEEENCLGIVREIPRLSSGVG